MCSGLQVLQVPGTGKGSGVEAALFLFSPSLRAIASTFAPLVSAHSPCSSAFVTALWPWTLYSLHSSCTLRWCLMDLGLNPWLSLTVSPSHLSHFGLRNEITCHAY